MRRGGWLAWLVAVSVAAWAVPAAADVFVGADLNGAILLDDGQGGSGRLGQGIDVRAGYNLSLVFAQLELELGGGRHVFPEGSRDPSLSVLRGFLGTRLRMGAMLQPAFYLRLGYGMAAREGPAPAGRVTDGGFTLDTGGGLDFTALPWVTLGVHGGYHLLQTGGSIRGAHFLVLGVNAAFTF